MTNDNDNDNDNKITRYFIFWSTDADYVLFVPETFSVFILSGQLLYKATLYESNDATYFSLRIEKCLFFVGGVLKAQYIDVNIPF